MGWGRVSHGPKGWGWGKKVFLVMQSKVGMGQNKTMQGGDEDPIAIPDGEYYSCFQPHGH